MHAASHAATGGRGRFPCESQAASPADDNVSESNAPPHQWKERGIAPPDRAPAVSVRDVPADRLAAPAAPAGPGAPYAPVHLCLERTIRDAYRGSPPGAGSPIRSLVTRTHKASRSCRAAV